MGKGKTSVIFLKGMNISSVLLLESALCCLMLGDQMVTWANILCGQSWHIELNIHCLTSVVRAFALSDFLVHLETLLLLFSKQQEYLLSASSARWFVYCLSILGWFGYHPLCSQFSLCFANHTGFNSFSPRKYHFITFWRHWRSLSKYDAWWIKNFKKIKCSPTGSPREIRRPAAILNCSPLPPPSCGIHLDQSR